MARTWRLFVAALVVALLGHATAITPSGANCPASYLSYNASALCCPANYALTQLDGSGNCRPFSCAISNNATMCGAFGDFWYGNDGPNFGAVTGWSSAASASATDYCTFGNVGGGQCSGGNPVSIALPGFGPSGVLPGSLGLLTTLTSIVLSGNTLSGTLPSSLASLTALRTLDVSGNQLSGTLPSFLASLTALTHLAVSSNQFSGSIPDVFANMPLTTASFDSNQFSGYLPSSLIALCASGLQPSLDASTGLMQNVIPPLLSLPTNTTTILAPSGACPSVHVLYQLPNLSAYTALTSIVIYGALTGTIPASLGSLTNLKSLRLYTNPMLAGTIPAALSSLSALTILDLDGNSLSGTLPDIFTSLTALQVLDLSSNNLNGTLPASLTSLQSLRCISLAYNQLNGTLSAAQVAFFGQMSSLNWLYGATCPNYYPTVYLGQQSGYALAAASASASPAAPNTSALQTEYNQLTALVAALQVNLTAAQAACSAAG